MIETCLWAHLTEEHIAELDAAPDEAATRRVLYSAVRLTPDDNPRPEACQTANCVRCAMAEVPPVSLRRASLAPPSCLHSARPRPV